MVVELTLATFFCTFLTLCRLAYVWVRVTLPCMLHTLRAQYDPFGFWGASDSKGSAKWCNIKLSCNLLSSATASNPFGSSSP